MTAGGNRTAYDVFVALHVACAVVGFGAVALSGVYGGGARHPERPETMEELRRYFTAPGRLELLIVPVPVFGAIALAVGPGAGRIDQLWVLVGLALWVVATVLFFGLVRPGETALRRVARAPEPGPPAAVLRRAGARLQWAAAVSDLIFVGALVVMVIKPGS